MLTRMVTHVFLLDFEKCWRHLLPLSHGKSASCCSTTTSLDMHGFITTVREQVRNVPLTKRRL